MRDAAGSQRAPATVHFSATIMVGRVTAFRGNIVTTPQFGQVHIAADQVVIVASVEHGGKILSIQDGRNQDELVEKYGVQPEDVVKLKVMCSAPTNHVIAS